jgi:hypothetical protein
MPWSQSIGILALVLVSLPLLHASLDVPHQVGTQSVVGDDYLEADASQLDGTGQTGTLSLFSDLPQDSVHNGSTLCDTLMHQYYTYFENNCTMILFNRFAHSAGPGLMVH